MINGGCTGYDCCFLLNSVDFARNDDALFGVGKGTPLVGIAKADDM